MSKPNKVNKNNYDQAGRLTPDDMARERINQGEISRSKRKEDVTGKVKNSGAGREPSRPRTSREEPE